MTWLIAILMTMTTATADMSDPAVVDALMRATPHAYAYHATRHEAPGARFHAWPYIRFLGNKVTEWVHEDDGRGLVNMAPRHGKSQLMSRWTPTWFLDRWPHKRVILASYGAELATHWGREVRNLVASNPFCRVKLREDSKAAGRWNTPEGGGMLCVGAGSAVTGFGGDLIIVDDPHKDWTEAQSRIQLERTWEWFEGTLYYRLEPQASMIVFHTRWNPLDLTGHLQLEHQDNWDHVVLKALAGDDDPVGRKLGEALCPQRFPAERLRHLRLLNPITFDAEFQQEPAEALHGRVYDHFTDANVDEALTLEHGEPLDLSFDFNVNPGMHVIIGQHRRTGRGDVQFFAVHEIHAEGMTVERAMQAFGKWIIDQGGWHWPSIDVFGDPAGRSRTVTTGQTSYQLIQQHLRQLGINHTLKVPAAQYHVIDRMNAFNDALRDGAGQSHYWVHPRCQRLIADLKTLAKDEDGLISKDDEKLSHASEAEANRVLRLRPLAGRSGRAVAHDGADAS